MICGLDLEEALQERLLVDREPVAVGLLLEGVADPLLPVDQGAVAVRGHPLDVFELRKGHEAAGLWQLCRMLLTPAASARVRSRPWTSSNTRESSCSPSTASPSPRASTPTPSTTPSRPPSEIGYPCVIKAQVADRRPRQGRRDQGRQGRGRGRGARRGDPRHGHPRPSRRGPVHRPPGLGRAGASEIDAEYYASIILDRSEKKLLAMLSTMGGMDVEEIAETDPDALVAPPHRARPRASTPPRPQRARGRRRDRRGRHRAGRRDAGEARTTPSTPRTRP